MVDISASGDELKARARVAEDAQAVRKFVDCALKSKGYQAV